MRVIRGPKNSSLDMKFPRFTPVVFALLALLHTNAWATPESATIGWLGGTAPGLPTGVSFGVPWPRGAMPKTQAFALTGADGKALPVQTWPLAYWPDGSLKWVAVATVASGAGELKLAPVS